MKTLNVTFTDEEYELLNKAKEASGLSWHDYIQKMGDKEDESQ